uniref:Uncharacterized protein n=1 Tax=Cucumis sativus TaxID=3659 RepID=A0A0A0LDK1_CUCSA
MQKRFTVRKRFVVEVVHCGSRSLWKSFAAWQPFAGWKSFVAWKSFAAFVVRRSPLCVVWKSSVEMRVEFQRGDVRDY